MLLDLHDDKGPAPPLREVRVIRCGRALRSVVDDQATRVYLVRAGVGLFHLALVSCLQQCFEATAMKLNICQLAPAHSTLQHLIEELACTALLLNQNPWLAISCSI